MRNKNLSSDDTSITMINKWELRKINGNNLNSLKYVFTFEKLGSMVLL